MEPVRMTTDFQVSQTIGKRQIRSTAGAITLKNDKGDLIVEKVKVTRYIAGKRPTYAPEGESEEEEDDEEEEIDEEEDQDHNRADFFADEINDEASQSAGDHGHRQRVRQESEDDEEDDEDGHEMTTDYVQQQHHQQTSRMEESSEEEEELNEEELERRREMLKRKAMARRQEKDVLDIEDDATNEQEEEDELESSEYEEYSESDDGGESGTRLKPVFVRRNDRVTLERTEGANENGNEANEKLRKLMEERKRQSTMLVSEILRSELKEEQGVEKEEQIIVTDDEGGEEEYEAWKVRELKRIKRDKDEKEAREKEKSELDRIHNMTEEERRAEFRLRPKEITNKASKGKYKFLQKYYHRGAFFTNQEDNLMTQDFAQPTLEDHFDKTILPKVMQVKNFGRSGRTKYTHLVDQDTTNSESAWFADNAQNLKFHTSHGGGMRQSFDRPTKKRK